MRREEFDEEGGIRFLILYRIRLYERLKNSSSNTYDIIISDISKS